ncbi:MAG: DNA ligase [Dethiobacter sp.]|nr:DNA ligase [Dethiobacter sp.]
MGRMSELDMVLREFHAAAKALIGACDSLRNFYNQAAESPVPDGAELPVPQPKPITLEAVRAVLAEKSRNGHTAEVRALLEKHGAAKLSEIDPAKYAALLAEAEVLGNG